MKHLRTDYDRIQDPFGKIGEDEPVFLLRAQDLLFESMLDQYTRLCRNSGLTELAAFIEAQRPAIREWRGTHKVKQPDLAPGAEMGFPPSVRGDPD